MKTLYSIENTKKLINQKLEEKKLMQAYNEKLNDACNYYLKNVPSTDEIYETVLNKAAGIYNFPAKKILERLNIQCKDVLTEAENDEGQEELKAIQKEADKTADSLGIDDDNIVILTSDEDLDGYDDEAELSQLMNDSYHLALRALKDYERTGRFNKDYIQDILVEGDVGCGKTEMVKSWCRHHNVRCIPVKAGQLSVDDIKGIPIGVSKDDASKAELVSTGAFDMFKGGKCVLFLDEYNRTNPSQRDFWFKFINEHEITDPKTGNKIFYPDLLFTVAAQNPYAIIDSKTGEVIAIDDEEGVSNLSKAEIDRFAKIIQSASKDGFNKTELKYLNDMIKQDTKDHPELALVNAFKLKVAEQILDDTKNATLPFRFDDTLTIHNKKTEGKKFCTPRGFAKALLQIDSVKDWTDFKNQFLLKIERNCGADTRKTIKTYIDKYDVKDVTNDLWGFWAKNGLKNKKELEKTDKKVDTKTDILDDSDSEVESHIKKQKTSSSILDSIKNARKFIDDEE